MASNKCICFMRIFKWQFTIKTYSVMLNVHNVEAEISDYTRRNPWRLAGALTFPKRAQHRDVTAFLCWLIPTLPGQDDLLQSQLTEWAAAESTTRWCAILRSQGQSSFITLAAWMHLSLYDLPCIHITQHWMRCNRRTALTNRSKPQNLLVWDYNV